MPGFNLRCVPQCRGCAGVLTSSQHPVVPFSFVIYICVSGYKFNKVGHKGVCRNCNVCKVCPLPLLYATFTDIFGLCQHSLIHFLHFCVQPHFQT